MGCLHGKYARSQATHLHGICLLDLSPHSSPMCPFQFIYLRRVFITFTASSKQFFIKVVITDVFLCRCGGMGFVDAASIILLRYPPGSPLEGTLKSSMCNAKHVKLFPVDLGKSFWGCTLCLWHFSDCGPEGAFSHWFGPEGAFSHSNGPRKAFS